jgi:hypothetical protein
MSDIDLDDHHLDCNVDCKKHMSERIVKTEKDNLGVKNNMRAL